MKSILDDRPSRKVPEPVLTRPVVLVSCVLFLKRGKTLQDITEDPSERVLDDFLANNKHATVVVVAIHHPGFRMDSTLQTYVSAGKLRLFVVDPNDVHGSNGRLRDLLSDLGVRLRPDLNRTMSTYNIGRFVISGDVKVIGPDDFAQAGVAPEKEETMQDLMTRRERSSWF